MYASEPMRPQSYAHPDEVTRHRILVLIAGMVLSCMLLLLRLWYLQVIEGDRFATLSESNRLRIIPQRDIRGQIHDRHGTVLVDSRRSFTLSLLPEETPSLELLLPGLKDHLPIRWEEVEPKLKSTQAYHTLPLLKDLTREQVAYVVEHRWDLPGVLLDVEHVRHYPYGELAAQAGGIIVMDPRNGEILAMASKPAYDPNLFVTGISAANWMRLLKDPRKPLQNRAIQGQYAPGSTYKIIMAVAALEEGIITPKTTVYCNGQFPFGNRMFKDWKPGGHGPVDVRSAMVQSCDVFFYTLGQRLGIDTIARYAKGFGLGAPTGFDPLHEKPGLVPSTAWKRAARGEPWYPGETISAAIGQGYNLMTPLQLLNVISAVANGGTLYKPQLVKRLETPDGKVVQEFAPERLGDIPARAETLRILQEALWGVVNEPRVPDFSLTERSGEIARRVNQIGEGYHVREKRACHPAFDGRRPDLCPRCSGGSTCDR